MTLTELVPFSSFTTQGPQKALQIKRKRQLEVCNFFTKFKMDDPLETEKVLDTLTWPGGYKTQSTKVKVEETTQRS